MSQNSMCACQVSQKIDIFCDCKKDKKSVSYKAIFEDHIIFTYDTKNVGILWNDILST
jgi:hypothetical protein